MTELILGVDGGQTSTAALLAASDGTILGAGAGGPANHIHEAGGMERMERSLRDAVTAAFAQAGIAPVAVASACFGMTGGAEFVAGVAAKFLAAQRLSAYHDVVTALAGASVAEPGIVVIAGTGAIAYGRSADGREAKADGWGYLMGDEGSAYEIGLKALQAAAQAEDGRGEATLLREYVPRCWRKANLVDVRALLYSEAMTRAEIAGLAWVTACAADAGDVVARNILATAGQRLAKSAQAVIAALGERKPVVYPTGGVFRAERWVLAPFERRLKELTADAEIRRPAFAQVVGALLLAQRQAGKPIDEAFRARLRLTLPERLEKENKSAERARDCADLSLSNEQREA